MNESQISVRYAKALFQSASEKQMLDEAYHDMELLSEICKLDDFTYMLVLPSLQASQKRKVTRAIFEPHLSELSISMINLVIRNKREIYLPGIARYFKDLYRKAKGIHLAKLETAQPVDKSILDAIKELIRRTYHAEVDLNSEIDPDLIGGFILTVEGNQYDASVASNLKKIKKQLLQSRIEKN